MERDFGASSSGLSSTVDSVSPSAVYHYAKHLKSKYKGVPISCDGKFPPTPSKKYVNLAVVRHKPRDLDEVMKYTLHGNIKEMLEDKEQINIEDILKPNEDQNALKLVVVEGPPGIGKSTLAWELCSRWDEISSMSQYDLVVLLRLRERSVQQIQNLSGLFPHHDSELRQSVAKEVLENEGDGVLFILDGFDELPVDHSRQSGLLIDLIKGEVLPKSSVLVTSRPSATTDLLTSCRPRVKKHVEILGFTEECVKEYASSVFSSEPKVLKDFLTYISASSNPVINSLMYVPLNAAIIVEIYRNSKKADRPIPKTLTQLYTQLCLTLIQRDLKNRDPSKKYNFHNIEALPKNHYTDLLKLAKIAFDGFKEGKIIFYSDMVPEDLVHFGLLNTVSSFCGGGDSHNFLHLTLQEFLVAYHISQSPHDDLQLFHQYICDKRWNLVWRFVAGLVGFGYFKDRSVSSEAFMDVSTDKHVDLYLLFIQCFFEAQIESFDYKAAFRYDKITFVGSLYAPLNCYMLGHCIARSAPTAFWKLELGGRYIDAFIWGLKSKGKCDGIIRELTMTRCYNCIKKLKQFPPETLLMVSSLTLSYCDFDESDIQSFAVIPQRAKLSQLSLSGNSIELVNILDALSNSNSFTSLKIKHVGHDAVEGNGFLTALAKLIDPFTGKLKRLHFTPFAIEDCIKPFCDIKEFCDLVFASSSLRNLFIELHHVDSLALLRTNTCLSCLSIEWETTPCMEPLQSVLRQNSTLRHLRLAYFKLPDDIMPLKKIVNALRKNRRMRELNLGICIPQSEAPSLDHIINNSFYMDRKYPELSNSDTRIRWIYKVLNENGDWALFPIERFPAMKHD